MHALINHVLIVSVGNCIANSPAHAPACDLIVEMTSTFEIPSMIRGNHAYKDRWQSFIGEELVCKHELHNFHDPFAVAVIKERNIVGHIPRTISAACYIFLNCSGATISCTVTRPRRYSRDLPQGGLEIPCNIRFMGEQNSINKIKALINKQKLQQKDCVASAGKIEAQTGEIDSSTTQADDNNKQQGKNDLPVHDAQETSMHISEIASKRSHHLINWITYS